MTTSSPRSRPTVLLTGFEPFAGATTNPSWDAVELVARDWHGPTLVTARLPVTFAGASATMKSLLDEHSPDVVIAAGLADNRDAITPERVAINVEDARIPDNEGDQPVDRPVIAEGPAAYFTRLPARAMVESIQAEGIPARLSDSAGTYVCNSLMYTLLHVLEHRPHVRAGFIHVPSTTAIELSRIAQALTLAVRAAISG